MTRPAASWLLVILMVGPLTLLTSNCVVSDGGYGYDGAGGIGANYYEPYGASYGGWSPGYRVGPVRDGRQFDHRGGARSSGHAYRAAPASRPIPSIPAQPRSGGGRSHGR